MYSCYNLLRNATWEEAQAVCKGDGLSLLQYVSFEHLGLYRNLHSATRTPFGEIMFIGLKSDKQVSMCKCNVAISLYCHLIL